MTKPYGPWEAFTSALLHELQAMSDDEVLDGHDAEEVRSRGLALLEAARTAAMTRKKQEG